MAVTATPGRSLVVGLLTTCQRVDGISACKEVSITAPAGADVYVIDDAATADGAALPSHYFRIPAGSGYVYPLQGPILLAGSTTGNATIRAL